jgi:hypothetical protein
MSSLYIGPKLEKEISCRSNSASQHCSATQPFPFKCLLTTTPLASNSVSSSKDQVISMDRGEEEPIFKTCQDVHCTLSDAPSLSDLPPDFKPCFHVPGKTTLKAWDPWKENKKEKSWAVVSLSFCQFSTDKPLDAKTYYSVIFGNVKLPHPPIAPPLIRPPCRFFVRAIPRVGWFYVLTIVMFTEEFAPFSYIFKANYTPTPPPISLDTNTDKMKCKRFIQQTRI